MEKGFAEADVITEGTFGYENIPNALPPESVGAVAMWEEPNKVTVWGTSQAPYMDKVTLFHVFNRQVEMQEHRNPVGGGFGTKFMCWQVQSYAILLEQGHREAGKGHVHKGRAHGHLHPEGRLPDSRQGRHEEGRHHNRHTGHLVCRHRILFLYYAGPGRRRLGRAHDHGPVPQLGPEEYRRGHQPERLGRTRGFGGQELKCSFIPLLCLAMEKADLDPFEVLKKNFVKPGGGYFWRDGELV